jgi:predicted dehydrogenase
LARPQSVALVGPSGIGRIHAREFHRVGVPVTAVLASTPARSLDAAHALTEEFGTVVEAYGSIEEISAATIDAAVICSPPGKHLEAIDVFLEAGKYVLCEKPLFWQDGLSTDAVGELCSRLATKADGRLVVNTNNTWFPEIWFEQHTKPDQIDEFGFHFYTNGPFRSGAIGVDLLPHALSVLLEIATGDYPDGGLADIEKTVSDDRFACSFDYGGIRCDIDLRQSPGRARAFGFRVNKTAVERIQRISGGEYTVLLAPAGHAEEAFQVADPFEISVRRFVDGIATGRRFDTEMAKSGQVMTMMTQLMTTPSAAA